jgi:aminopeptidase N
MGSSLLFSVLLALPTVLAGLHATVRADEPGHVVCSRAKAAFAADAAARLAPAWARAVEETAAETDVQHYALGLEIVPSLNWLGGTNQITVTSELDGLQRFRFWLSDRLAITRVTVDGGDAQWQRLDEATVQVVLDRPRSRGQTFVVAITYSGYPALDTPGISFETRHGHPDVTTRSEPWYAYIWWPVKEDNRDKATGDITLIVPEDLVGVSNGLLIDTLTADGKRHSHWRTQYPTAPYLFFVSVTNYTTFNDVAELDGRPMPLNFFIRPEEDTPRNRDLALRTKDMLQAFGAMFGTYPFIDEKYGIYQFSHGGMEHQTISGQTGFTEDVTSHELAHQWWGDMVTCATWHDMWLNEGFATYAEALWLEHEAGQDAAAALKAAMAQRRPEDPSGSVYVHDISSASSIFTELTYQKGAWVLHMLRHVLGDQTFFSVLKRYGAERAYGTATTEDFRAVAEEVAGRDLRWFFDEWVYGGGAPSYGLSWREDLVAGHRYLEIYVDQAQAPAEPVFRMPLDVRISGASGQSDVSLLNDAVEEHYLLPVDAPVDSVLLDPGGWILTTGTQEVAFVTGPPKIVEVVPEPGTATGEGTVTEITVTFHEDVIADGSDFALVGEHVGKIPLGFAYDRATTTVRLVPEQLIPADRYSLTISDSVTGAVSGEQLDGEIGERSGASALPSGDGTPGGDAVVWFSVQRAPRLRLHAG